MENLNSYQFTTLSDISNLSFLFNLVCTPCTLNFVKLSKMTGISKSTLNNIENEKVSPTIAELEAIAKALNMKITDLFDSDYK